MFHFSDWKMVAAWLCASVGTPLGFAASETWVSLRNLEAARDAAEGRRATANAAWFGFDPQDATPALQSAIQSKARLVIIPNVGAPWIIRPVELRDNLELWFEPGVVVLAKAGEFKGGGDCLFRAQDRTNITIRGPGATLRMRKSDYQRPPYPKAEWRMGLSFCGCRDVLVEGLRIESTGGDGIYIASSEKNRWSENVTVRNCVCDDNHRQGISVISAVNLLIEDCVLSRTRGTPPEAGIDLEPDLPDERLINCVVRNCLFEDNHGNGMLVYLKPLTGKSEPVSVRFERCVARMGGPGAQMTDLSHLDHEGASGIAVGWVRDGGPKGLIEFVDCSSENTGREAARVADKSAEGVLVRFVNCRWTNSWVARHREYAGFRAPILVENRGLDFCRRPGGIEWADCTVIDSIHGPIVRFEDDSGKLSLRDVHGRIAVKNSWGAKANLGPEPTDVDLRLDRVEGPP